MKRTVKFAIAVLALFLPMFLVRIGTSVYKLIRLLLYSADLRSYEVADNEECVILGNGPSLSVTLTESLHFLEGKKKFCVNDFARSDYFFKVRPDYYVFLDPAYLDRNLSAALKEMFSSVCKNLEKTDWPLVIFMPINAKSWNYFMDLPTKNRNITIVYYSNLISPFKNKKIKFWLYKHGLAMPYTANVLCGTIFLALNLNFKKIYFIGADHNWHESIGIEGNTLVLKDGHFYDKDKPAAKPVYWDAAQTKKFTVGEFLSALANMFNSYHELKAYADYLNAKVFNASKISYIDAFERYQIKEGKKIV